MRWVALAMLAGCGRIGFDPLATSDAGPDAPSDALVVPNIGRYWVTTAESRAIPAFWVTRPLDDAGFGTPCPEAPATDDYLFLLGHPTLPYAYGLKDDLRGIALGCGATTETLVAPAAFRRPNMRAILDPTASVGFMTLDGAAQVAVFQFTVAANGVPAANTSADGPAVSSSLALDAPNSLFVGGDSVLGGYVLGNGLTLPATFAFAPTCAAPIDLIASGTFVLSFCQDTPQIFRNLRDPITPSQVGPAPGSPGPFDRAIPLPGDRAVAARSTPPQLLVLALEGGIPTWTDGPLLPARVTALAASADGSVVIATWPTSPSTATIGAWAVVGDVLVPLGSVDTDTIITAATITPPP